MKKKRVLLVSCSVILVCMSIIVGMTYALFTDNVVVENHLKAGNLDVTLKRTSLEYAVLDDDGLLKVTTVNDELDFTERTEDNVFGIDSTDVRIVPGSYFEATLEVGNNGSTAFDYNVEIKLEGESNSLAEQLKVIVTHNDGSTTEKMLSEIADGLSISAGSMKSSDNAQSFKVKVEFIDVAYNNDAQDLSCVFDLVVSATQATTQS